MMKKLIKIISIFIITTMLLEQTGFAQVAVQLDISARVSAGLSNIIQDKFRPIHLRYLEFNPTQENFKLLLDKGSVKNPNQQLVDETTKELLKYFLIGVSLPNDAFWVNLRPDASNEIIDENLAKTDVGKILLEADLQLKKDTAKYTSPQTLEGKEYWNKLYHKAEELYGNSQVSIPTLNRPWIVPDEIIVRENQGSAYIYKATLKVMLEGDYLKGSQTYNFTDEKAKALNEYSSQLLKEQIIPKITKEINSAKRYAALRQVYYSLILAQWFKKVYGSNSMDSRFRGNDSKSGSRDDISTLLGNMSSLTSKESWSKEIYYQAYQKSFKEGEYNVKEPRYTSNGQVIKSYVSGGITFGIEINKILSDGGVFRSTTAIGKEILNKCYERIYPVSNVLEENEISYNEVEKYLNINDQIFESIKEDLYKKHSNIVVAYIKNPEYDLKKFETQDYENYFKIYNQYEYVTRNKLPAKNGLDINFLYAREPLEYLNSTRLNEIYERRLHLRFIENGKVNYPEGLYLANRFGVFVIADKNDAEEISFAKNVLLELEKKYTYEDSLVSSILTQGIDLEKYYNLQEKYKVRLRKLFFNIFENYKWDKYHPFFKKENLDEFIMIANGLLHKYPKERIVSLGRSPIWLTETVKLIESLQEDTKDSSKNITNRYLNVFFSAKYLKLEDISLTRKLGYRKYLKGIGLSIEDIINSKEKTVLVDYVYSGGSIKLFLDLLLDWAQEKGTDINLLKEKIVVEVLIEKDKNVPNLGDLNSSVSYFSPYLIFSLSNNLFEDNLGFSYSPEEWETEFSTLNKPRDKYSALVKFMIIDYLVNDGGIAFPNKVIQRPLLDSRFNAEMAKDWINHHPDSLSNFDFDSSITKGTAKKYVESIRYVTQDEFELNLQKMVDQFNTENPGLDFEIIYDSRDAPRNIFKSNFWVLALALEKGLKPVEIISIEDAVKKQLDDIAVVDDASYSGEQVYSIAKELAESGIKRIHILVPYISNMAYLWLKGLEKYYETKILIYEQERFRLLNPELIKDNYALYFQHNLPDSTSFSKRLAKGSVNGYGKYFKFIPDIIKPYQFSYEVRVRQTSFTNDYTKEFELVTDKDGIRGGNADGTVVKKYKDKTGKIWLFKGYPEGRIHRAYVDEAISRFLIKFTEEYANKYDLWDNNINLVRSLWPGFFVGMINGKQGSFSEWIDNNGSLWEEVRKYGKFYPRYLSAEILKRIVREQVIDWLFSNHDAHPGHFLLSKDANNPLVTIDKAQAFKYFNSPNEKLDVNYNPNELYNGPGNSYYTPIYNLVLSSIARGECNITLEEAYKEVEKMINVIMPIKQEEYRSYLVEYARVRFDQMKDSTNNIKTSEEFLTLAVKRKESLREDFKIFYEKLGLKTDDGGVLKKEEDIQLGMHGGRQDNSFKGTYPQELLKIIKSFPGDIHEKLVLDIGSGEGQITEWLNEQGIKAIGVEPSESYIDSARKYALIKKMGIDYVQIGRDGKLPFKDQSVDGIVLHRVLSAILDPNKQEQILSEIKRVLKPHGIISFYDFEKTQENDLFYSPVYQRRYKVSQEIYQLLQKSKKFSSSGLIIPSYVQNNYDLDMAYFVCFNVLVNKKQWDGFDWNGTKPIGWLDFKLDHLYTPTQFIKAYEAGLIEVTFIGQHISQNRYEKLLRKYFNIVKQFVEPNFVQYEKEIMIPAIKIIAQAVAENEDFSEAQKLEKQVDNIMFNEMDQKFKEWLESPNGISSDDRELIKKIIGANEKELQKLINENSKVYISKWEKETTDGRTVYLNLEKAFGKIKVLRFKGVRPRFKNGTNEVLPYTSGVGFSHEEEIIDNKTGNHVYTSTKLDSFGTMEKDAAVNEYEIMKKLKDLNKGFDYPISVGVYKNMTFNNNSIGFVVAGMENIDYRLFINEEDKLVLLDPTNGAFIDIDSQKEQVLTMIGRQMRIYHDNGNFHRWMFLGNIGVDYDKETKKVKRIVIRDLDETQRKEKIEFENEKIKNTALTAWRLLDLYRIMNALKYFYNSDLDSYDYSLIIAVLKGYFYDLNFNSSEFVSLMLNIGKVPLWLTIKSNHSKLNFDSQLVKFLYKLEDGGRGDSFGGINFSSLPIMTQRAVEDLIRDNSKYLISGVSRLNVVDLDKNLNEMQKMLDSGILPSANRIKECVQEAVLRENYNEYLDQLLGCISETIKLEEERSCATNKIVKDLLLVLDFGMTHEQMKQIFKS